MNENANISNTPLADNEIDLRELFSAIRQGKWIIMFTTFIVASAGVFYALSLPNVYKSDVLLAPAGENASFNMSGQLGSLAALAGVSLGGAGTDKTGLAIEILKSREFIGRFIQKHDLFVPVMAAEGWSRADNSLVIDAELYNTETQEWVREIEPPFEAKPSVLETYKDFMELLNISQDQSSGMVTLSVSHYSPFLAKEWVMELVKAINDEMRNRELTEAQDSIDYLNSQIEQTNNADARTMLFSLIEEQSKTVMLANVRDEYVFKTVDPAVVSEKKASPARAVICLVAAMLGFTLGVIIAFIVSFNKA